MRQFLTLLLLLAAFLVGKQIFSYWKQVESGEASKPVSTQVDPKSLPGMPPELEQTLYNVTQLGPQSLGKWLDYYRPRLSDPRLAWIELDYVLMISRENPEEARRIFQDVKGRTPKTSPVYSRIKQLEKTYD